eukprot:CAMPEP_0182449044 /NCGR_PEP_ID=MMETSP1172-20130603/31509_1 /TAXON_ID=708627 /ORGANISM="Timspurckia oligopyrenoides, Strain CCMP3278" /LENGTH=1335 /DNA_ID=CAMNT_0024646139 /DNA_START=350 /DNA_END=4357 /DNA_ORIENTATION=-
MIHYAGILTSALVLAVSYQSQTLFPNLDAFQCHILKVSAVWTFGEALQSDLFGLFIQSEYHNVGHFFCGNFGALVMGSPKYIRNHIEVALEDMIKMTMLRGGQAGGIVTYFPSFFNSGSYTSSRIRIVNSKRANLAESIVFRLRIVERIRAIASVLHSIVRKIFLCAFHTVKQSEAAASNAVHRHVRLFQGHTRFATSSLVRKREAHPHRWVPPKMKTVWEKNVIQGGYFTKVSRRVEHFLTHNGDFDFMTLYVDEDNTVSEVHQWLQRVLNVENFGIGDSINIAGLLDLLCTQGMWFESVRLAYVLYILKHIDDEIPHGLIAKLAELFETEFELWNEALLQKSRKPLPPRPDSIDGDALMELYSPIDNTDILVLVARLQTALDTHYPDLLMSEIQRGVLCVEAVDAFFRNGMFQATVLFLERAKGSFGLTASNSINPNQVVIAAHGQPMFLGWDSERCNAVFFGSEIHAIEKQCKEFLELESTYGEIVELAVSEEKHGVPFSSFHAEEILLEGMEGEQTNEFLASMRESLFVDDVEVNELGKTLSNYTTLIGRRNQDGTQSSIQFRSFGLHDQKYVDPEAFTSRIRRFDSINNSSVPHAEPEEKFSLNSLLKKVWHDDVVAQDLKDLPRVVTQIDQEWRKETSANHAASAELTRCFMQLAHTNSLQGMSKRKSDHGLEFLVVGVEVSLWIAEQFVSDLAIAFPKIRAAAWSSNKILDALGTFRDASGPVGFNHGGLQTLPWTLNPKAIIILVTQSGVTFPTYHSAKVLERILPGRVFIITSDRTNLICGVVDKHSNSRGMCTRVITNCSGMRPAEPSSVALVASHHTLSCILKTLMAATFQEFGGKLEQRPFGMAFGSSELKSLYDAHSAFSQYTLKSICDGSTEVHRNLIAAGRHWGAHIVEPLFVVVLSTIYIVVTVTFTGPPVTSLANFSSTSSKWAQYAVRFVDSLIYVFLPFWTAMLIRIVTRRQLLDRLGKRTLVIADIPWVHQSLESFTSKLFSLSFNWMGVDVHGANPSDHFVHRFTHRVSRGVLLALGRPDGRLIALSKREADSILSVLQAKCIQNLGSGPEVFSVGHNPYQPRVLNRDKHVVLPVARKKFFCEEILGMTSGPNLSIHAIMGVQEKLISRKSTKTLETSGALVKARTKILNVEALPKMDHTVNRRRLLVGQLEDISMSRHNRKEAAKVEHPDSTVHASLRDALVETTLRHQSALEESNAAKDAQRAETAMVTFARLETNSILLCEGRYFSAERYTSFCVAFHAMAKVCSIWWPLHWDIAHSQSYLKVASTAAPVSAADMSRVLGKDDLAANPPSKFTLLDGASYHKQFASIHHKT